MTSEEPTFSELLEEAKTGKEGARDALFEFLADQDEAGAQLLAIARKILPRGDLARDLVESRDLVQSALRVGWLELDNFRGETAGELMAWLRTILRHKLLRRTRKKNPRIGHAEAVEPPETPGPQADEPPLEQAIREETLARLHEAITELGPDYRVVMERRLAGVPSKEVAEELSLEPATVRKRESRAVARLREILSRAPGA